MAWIQSDRDLRSLIAEASRADLQEAERSLSLITERGYHRGRDLPSLFRQLLDTLRPGSFPDLH